MSLSERRPTNALESLDRADANLRENASGGVGDRNARMRLEAEDLARESLYYGSGGAVRSSQGAVAAVTIFGADAGLEFGENLEIVSARGKFVGGEYESLCRGL